LKIKKWESSDREFLALAFYAECKKVLFTSIIGGKMSTIDRELVMAINSGRCLAVVGSDPSNEEGVLSWEALTDQAISLLRSSGDISGTALAERLYSQKKYPEVFGVLEKKLGRDCLVELVQELVVAPVKVGLNLPDWGCGHFLGQLSPTVTLP